MRTPCTSQKRSNAKELKTRKRHSYARGRIFLGIMPKGKNKRRHYWTGSQPDKVQRSVPCSETSSSRSILVGRIDCQATQVMQKVKSNGYIHPDCDQKIEVLKPRRMWLCWHLGRPEDCPCKMPRPATFQFGLIAETLSTAAALPENCSDDEQIQLVEYRIVL